MNSHLHFSSASLTTASTEQTGLEPAALPAPAPEEEVGRGRGRPGLLTGELAAEMYKLIRVYGLTDSRAGLLAGASTSSVSRWKDEDEQFRDYLETARAEFELNRTLKLLEATRPDGSPDWRAHAWLLKNSQRDEARKPGRPRTEEGERGRQGEALRAQKIPENRAALGDLAPAAAVPAEVGVEGENTQEIPENRRSFGSAAPAAVIETSGGNTQRIPENGAHREDAAPPRPAMSPRPHEKIPENHGCPAMEEVHEAA